VITVAKLSNANANPQVEFLFQGLKKKRPGGRKAANPDREALEPRVRLIAPNLLTYLLGYANRADRVASDRSDTAAVAL
jgi:hypothetical protein